MSRTYRRRNPSRKNNTNFPVSRYYTDFQIVEDEDLMYLRRWKSVENNHVKNKKAALAYYHSDLYRNSYSHRRKTKFVKNSFKSLRRVSNIILNNFVKSNDKENFNDIIQNKPKDILWDVY